MTEPQESFTPIESLLREYGQHRELPPEKKVAESPAEAAADDDPAANMFHGAKSMAVAQVLTQLSRFGTNLVLARLLAPKDFGLVAIASVVILFLDQIKDAGTGSAIIQREQVDDRLLNAVFYLNFLLGVALAGSLALSAGPTAHLLGSPGATNLLRAFSVITLITSLGQVHHAMLRRNLKFREIAVVNTGSAVSSSVVSIVLALAGVNVWALVIGQAVYAIVGTALAWHYDAWRPSRNFHLSRLTEIWSYSVNLFLLNLVGVFFGEIDKVLVSRRLGVIDLGLYAMALRVVTYPISAIADVVNEVAFPALSRQQNDEPALRQGVISASRVIAFVTFPLMGTLAAMARPAIDTVFGDQWTRLVPLIWILAPLGAIQSVSGISGQLLLAKGRSDWLFRFSFLGYVITGTAYFLGLHWGLIGLCLLAGIVSFILAPLSLMLAFKTIKLRLWDFLRGLGAQTAITAFMVIVLCSFTLTTQSFLPPAAIFIIGLIVAAAAYLGPMLVFKPAAFQDARKALLGNKA